MTFFERHKRLLILLTATALILVVMALSAAGAFGSGAVTRVFGTVLTPVQKCVTALTNGIGGFFNFLFEMDSYRAENDALTARIAELERERRSVQDYREENEQLRQLLEVQQQRAAEFQTTGASVVGWSADNWIDYFTIDKGTLDNVHRKAMVLSGDGLVGYVYEEGPNYSKVLTIVDSSSSVGAVVARTGDVAMVVGDPELEREGLCKMTFMNRDAQIVAGDIATTSGLGGVYKPGIPIGRVLEVKADPAGVSSYAVIEPLADLSDTHYVLVETGAEKQ